MPDSFYLLTCEGLLKCLLLVLDFKMNQANIYEQVIYGHV